MRTVTPDPQRDETAPVPPASASAAALGAAPGLQPGTALLVVDVQRDFLPGGRLAVPHGERILPALGRVVARCAELGLPVFASRDWHPPDHCSFHGAGGTWPVHCVAGSSGARFAEGLALPVGAVVVSKARDRAAEAYSAFDGTGLDEALRRAGVTRVVVAGLATDYCVLHSVLDAIGRGFAVTVLRDAIAAVDLRPGDGARALARMCARGAAVVDSARLLAPTGAVPPAQQPRASTERASARTPAEKATS